MLRHTPVNHANIKYFWDQNNLTIPSSVNCWYPFQLASIYCFLGEVFLFYFFCLKHCQCVLFILLLVSVHSSPGSFSSLLSIQLSSSSTNSRYPHWHTSKRLTSLTQIITLTHWVMPPHLFLLLFLLLFLFFFKSAQQKQLGLKLLQLSSCLKEQGLKVSNIKLNISLLWN